MAAELAAHVATCGRQERLRKVKGRPERGKGCNLLHDLKTPVNADISKTKFDQKGKREPQLLFLDLMPDSKARPSFLVKLHLLLPHQVVFVCHGY